MEGMTRDSFLDTLTRGRERFNARFKAAWSANPSLNPDEFAAHLRGPVAGLVATIAAKSPDRAEAVATTLYDTSLDLFRHDLLGSRARSGLIASAWTDLLPLLAGLLAGAPQKVAASVFNALHNLSQESEPSAAAWLKLMIRLAPQCANNDELNRVGLVLAWRCGLPHYRETALNLWAGLPDKLKLMTLDIAPAAFSGNPADLGQRLGADPWLLPAAAGSAKKLTIASVCGGFTGFGGPFRNPPKVSVSDGTLVAWDSESGWTLHADIWGSSFKRLKNPELLDEDSNQPGITLRSGGKVTFGAMSADIPELTDFSSWAATANTLAVTLRQSHFVYIVAAITRE